MRQMSQRPYLDYYIANKIVPVRQNIRDLNSHYRRREALYRHLGIVPAVVRGRRVIEFGPGTGDNALYTASLLPELYLFVDGNPFSIAHLREKVATGMLRARSVEYIECDVNSFEDPRAFELVLCEGIVHAQSDPAAFLRRMARSASSDGIVVATTHSAISLFPEVCRRIVYPIFATRFSDRATLVQHLVEFFKTDLSHLPGMSRLPEDWVQDNIMQPWPDPEQLVFTIDDAIIALEDDFDLLSTSPRFLQDWRWYKSIADDPRGFNQHAQSEVARWALYLLDHRIEPVSQGVDVAEIEAACWQGIRACNVAWRTSDEKDIVRFLEVVDDIVVRLKKPAPRTSHSLNDFVSGVQQLLAGHEVANFGDFRSLFGRGQQYASFIRKQRL
jgi:ubiquinone/menaquinone biosynthesis C-methylase UbiE